MGAFYTCKTHLCSAGFSNPLCSSRETHFELKAGAKNPTRQQCRTPATEETPFYITETLCLPIGMVLGAHVMPVMSPAWGTKLLLNAEQYYIKDVNDYTEKNMLVSRVIGNRIHHCNQTMQHTSSILVQVKKLQVRLGMSPWVQVWQKQKAVWHV